MWDGGWHPDGSYGAEEPVRPREPVSFWQKRRALVLLVPFVIWLVVQFIIDWVPQQRMLALLAATGPALLLGLAVGARSWLVTTIRRRVLHARPTEYCRVCGYPAGGLETLRVESGTLPFDQARCPECGRANPR